MARGTTAMPSAAHPKRAIALRNRAFRYRQLGDFDHAIADYTTALSTPEQHGVEVRTYLNRGLLYFLKGNEAHALSDYGRAVALDDYNRAIELNPKDAEALRGRGYLSLIRHDAQAAALRINPSLR